MIELNDQPQQDSVELFEAYGVEELEGRRELFTSSGGSWAWLFSELSYSFCPV